MPSLDHVIALATVAVVAESFEIGQVVAPALGKREAMMDLEPNSESAGATPDTRKMIALQDKKTLPQGQGGPFARRFLRRDERVARNRLLRDGITCADECLAPTPEAAGDCVVRHGKP